MLEGKALELLRDAWRVSSDDSASGVLTELKYGRVDLVGLKSLFEAISALPSQKEFAAFDGEIVSLIWYMPYWIEGHAANIAKYDPSIARQIDALNFLAAVDACLGHGPRMNLMG